MRILPENPPTRTVGLQGFGTKITRPPGDHQEPVKDRPVGFLQEIG
jgi:hypothetical protein